jgi:membrane protein HdeD
LGGIVSVALGLLVLFNLFTASYVLLGVLIGIEVIAGGIAMMLVGRIKVVTDAGAHPQRMAT